jgi:S-adenosylmethionine-dependent methyltransferase
MDAVERYYNTSADREQTRLDRHRTEFAVTLRALIEFLPSAPAAVLDVGGGPGRYAVALTQRGYHVTLLDLAQQNLILAAEHARASHVTLAGLVHGNALNLSIFPAASDAVAVRAAVSFAHRRRATPGDRRSLARIEARGCICRRVRYALCAVPHRGEARSTPARATAGTGERLLAVGADEEANDFPHVYFAHPLEVQPMLEQFGVQTLRIVGCEGVVAGMEERVNALEGEAWETWVDWNYRLGQDPVLYGAADHLLYVGRKP